MALRYICDAKFIFTCVIIILFHHSVFSDSTVDNNAENLNSSSIAQLDIHVFHDTTSINNPSLFIVFDQSVAYITDYYYTFNLINGTQKLAFQLKENDSVYLGQNKVFAVKAMLIGKYYTDNIPSVIVNQVFNKTTLLKSKVGRNISGIKTDSLIKLNLSNIFQLNKNTNSFFIVDINFLSTKKKSNFLDKQDDKPKHISLYSSNNNQLIVDDIKLINYLFEKYKIKYPNILYFYYPDSVSINAYASFFYDTDLKKIFYISINGGAIKNNILKSEGVSLFIAHELAHIYGGNPSMNKLISCEGQADYFATKVIQKKVWESQANSVCTEGIYQVEMLFKNGLHENLFAKKCEDINKVLCYTHPCASCRIETFKAGLYDLDKPKCAGKPSGVK